MDKLVALLEASGTLEFPVFVARAREQGLQPSLWLRAKQSGLLRTWIAEDGKLMIAAGAAVVGGQ